MARPTTSNPSTADVTGLALTWAHTAESGKTIYVIACPFNGADPIIPATETCTFGGVAMTLKAKLHAVGAGFRFVFVYTLVNPTPGAANIVFTTGYNLPKTAVAFNVTDGPVNGDIILPGMWNETAATLQKKAYAWEDDAQATPGGTQIVLGQTQLAHSPTIAEGTTIASGAGLVCHSIDTTDAEITFNLTRGGVGGDLVLFSFTIPPGSDSLTSGTFQLVPTGQISANSLAVNASIYAGLPYGNHGSQGRLGNIIPAAGTWHSFQINSNVVAGAGNEATIEIYRGGSSDSILGIGTNYEIPTGIILTIGGAAQQSNKVDAIALSNYKYERLSLRVINTGAGTLPATFTLRATFNRECGIANEQIQTGGAKNFSSQGLDVISEKATLHPMPLQWSNFPNNDKSLIGIPGDFEEYVADYQSWTLLADDYRFYFRHNGVLQDGSGTTVDTEETLISNTLGTALARWRGTLPVVAGDFLANSSILKDASSAKLRQAISTKFKPSISEDLMISGGMANTLVTGAAVVFNASGGGVQEQKTTAQEDQVKIIIPPLTAMGRAIKVKGLRIDLDGDAPGLGKSITEKFRLNSADSGIELTLSDAETIKTVAGDVDLVEDDSIDALFSSTGTPNVVREFWTIPGSSAPTSLGTIIVQKVTGGNTTADFTFVATGITPTPFILQGGGQQIYNNVTIGNGYGFVETPASGWQQDSVTVSNGSPIDDISVTTGEVVYVVFTNSLIAPANNPSGIYEMIPGKTNDTMWVDVSLGVTVDIAIP